MTVAITATALAKRYGRRWALRDCTVEVPAGSIAGLVGPNGAGKTTLLHLAAGLLRPSGGAINVLGERAGSSGVISRVGFVGQDKPLYGAFRVRDILQFGAQLNPNWNNDLAQSWVDRLGLEARQRVGQLSRGQRTQLALALALGKQPDLLLLDEPVADLDPLARRDFLGMLMEQVAESQVTVLMSSHVMTDLERVCDHLVLLSAGQVQLTGQIDQLLAEHTLLSGPADQAGAFANESNVVQERTTGRQTTLLLRNHDLAHNPAWAGRPVGLEELVLAYMSASTARPASSSATTTEDQT